MASITRQQLTDCISPEELEDDKRMERFQRSKAWLFLSWTQNDLIQVTDAWTAQVRAAFPAKDWPQTRKSIETLIGGP